MKFRALSARARNPWEKGPKTPKKEVNLLKPLKVGFPAAHNQKSARADAYLEPAASADPRKAQLLSDKLDPFNQ